LFTFRTCSRNPDAKCELCFGPDALLSPMNFKARSRHRIAEPICSIRLQQYWAKGGESDYVKRRQGENTPTSKSVRLNTSKRVTRIATCPRKKRRCARGPRWMRSPEAERRSVRVAARKAVRNASFSAGDIEYDETKETWCLKRGRRVRTGVRSPRVSKGKFRYWPSLTVELLTLHSFWVRSPFRSISVDGRMSASKERAAASFSNLISASWM